MNVTRWLLGITGGIAAYKTPELIRLLKKQGAQVRVVLSPGAKAFVTPMTLQAVSGHPVYSELLDCDFEAAMGHIELARWAQGILIAPLSANRLAALAMGMGDDLLSTLCLATQAPIWAMPAMNQQMWQHPAVQHNVAILKARGMKLMDPAWGEQACGEIGWGRMPEPAEIVRFLLESQPQAALLKDLRLLITAGPTREAIDPVRFLSNRSSGKMGFALAKAASAMGAKVTLISGPVNLETPPGVNRINVISAQEMYSAVMQQATDVDIFISAAAVADFFVADIAQEKIKKSTTSQAWQLSLTSTPDILAAVANLTKRPFCVGFAAETQMLAENARKKLIAKNLDLIAVNDVSQADVGFDAPDNALTVMSANENYSIEKADKFQVACQLLKLISEKYHAKNSAQNS